MAGRIRVMIADDSSVTRKILTAAISLDMDLEVVAAALNGDEAVNYCRGLKPDVILMDVEMPQLTGIEALREIRKFNPQVPIIMFSTLTVRGGEATLDALQAGATDYVAKPTGVGHVDKAISYLQLEVVPKLKLWGRRNRNVQENAVAIPRKSNGTGTPENSSGAVARSGAVPAVTPGPEAAADPAVTNPIELSEAAFDFEVSARKRRSDRRKTPVMVLGIGSSTGGPNALAELISRLPASLNVPVLITQHMPPIFTQLLAERLDRCSQLTVREGYDGAVLKAGEVWIAPGDHHMMVARDGTSVVIRTTRGAPENSCRPAVDVMFRSLAQVFGAGTLAVVLTGMGRDGTAGCQALSQAGAWIMVQDESSSVVWGMPRVVAEAGLADAVFPLNEMHSAVMTRVCGSSALHKVTV
ncbi:MAG: chemotaxis response regulator protein-glutamate methylesterase [Planctomyces sp.]